MSDPKLYDVTCAHGKCLVLAESPEDVEAYLRRQYGQRALPITECVETTEEELKKDQFNRHRKRHDAMALTAIRKPTACIICGDKLDGKLFCKAHTKRYDEIIVDGVDDWEEMVWIAAQIHKFYSKDDSKHAKNTRKKARRRQVKQRAP